MPRANPRAENTRRGLNRDHARQAAKQAGSRRTLLFVAPPNVRTWEPEREATYFFRGLLYEVTRPGHPEGIEVGVVLAESVKRMDPPDERKRDTRKQRARRALEALCNGDDAPYYLGDDACLSVC